jgi:hypothetical protein
MKSNALRKWYDKCVPSYYLRAMSVSVLKGWITSVTENAHVPLCIAAFASVFWPTSSQAIEVQIDEARVVEDGSGAYAVDLVANSSTPPQEPWYPVNGSHPDGSESGGRLALNSNWGDLRTLPSRTQPICGACHNTWRGV